MCTVLPCNIIPRNSYYFNTAVFIVATILYPGKKLKASNYRDVFLGESSSNLVLELVLTFLLER